MGSEIINICTNIRIKVLIYKLEVYCIDILVIHTNSAHIYKILLAYCIHGNMHLLSLQPLFVEKTVRTRPLNVFSWFLPLIIINMCNTIICFWSTVRNYSLFPFSYSNVDFWKVCKVETKHKKVISCQIHIHMYVCIFVYVFCVVSPQMFQSSVCSQVSAFYCLVRFFFHSTQCSVPCLCLVSFIEASKWINTLISH